MSFYNSNSNWDKNTGKSNVHLRIFIDSKSSYSKKPSSNIPKNFTLSALDTKQPFFQLEGDQLTGPVAFLFFDLSSFPPPFSPTASYSILFFHPSNHPALMDLIALLSRRRVSRFARVVGWEMRPANKTRTNESNSPPPSSYYVTGHLHPCSVSFRVIDVPAIKLIKDRSCVSLSALYLSTANGKVSRRGTRSAAWHDLLFHGSFVRATHAPTLVYFRTPSRVIHVNRARHCLIQFYSDLVIRLPR